jgi:hypothetical protein
MKMFIHQLAIELKKAVIVLKACNLFMDCASNKTKLPYNPGD